MLGALCVPAILNWPVQVEQAAVRKEAASACHQSLRRRPGCDMDHVDRKHRIGARHGPGLCTHIERQGGEDIGQASGLRMRRDTSQGFVSTSLGCQDKLGNADAK